MKTLKNIVKCICLPLWSLTILFDVALCKKYWGLNWKETVKGSWNLYWSI